MLNTNKLVKTPLSNIDLNNFVKDINAELGQNHEVNIFTTDEMIHNSAEFKKKLFKHGYCIIFLNPHGANIGHWTIIFLDNNKQVYFFDSYGNHPSKLDPKFSNFLKRHLPSSIYSTIQYQEYGNNVATCGRYCMFVLGLKRMIPDLNIDIIHIILKAFKKKYKKSYDYIVSHFINFDI